MKISVLGTLVILICAPSLAWGDAKSFFATPGDITGPINALKGKSVDDALAYLGLPDKEMTIVGRKVLVWESEPDNAVRNGNQIHAFHCTVKLVVSDAGEVTLVEIDTDSAYYCPRGK